MTRPEDERSLQKRPDNLPEDLIRGGLIVGTEPSIGGSLMSVAGVAIERITRERTEVPPQFRLPERPVYFLDPNTRRLISISNREKRQPFKSGLFAEMVELDEKGEPQYTLSTSEVTMPDGNFQAVAVAPNNFGLPPSHIPVVKQKEDDPKKQEFVPWNLYLGQLQDWMNEVTINLGEDFQSFVDRFRQLRKSNEQKVEETIKRSFPGGEQGFDENILPVNLIITDKGQESFLVEASLAAGLYPLVVTPRDFVQMPKTPEDWFDPDFIDSSARVFHNVLRASDVKVAVITRDQEAIRDYIFSVSPDNERALEVLQYGVFNMQKESPVFAIVDFHAPPDQELINEYKKAGKVPPNRVRKAKNGWFSCAYSEELYRGLLNKLKADLLLTMFIRGGAPMVK